MADLFAISDGILESNRLDRRVLRERQGQLTEILPGVAVVEAFANLVALRHDDGIVVLDTPSRYMIDAVIEALRAWSDEPITHVVYTHGHVDHTSGAPSVLADAERRGHARPLVVAHANVGARMRRYAHTAGYNTAANRRQFAGVLPLPDGSLVPELVEPDLVFDHELELDLGGLELVLYHGKGETDDHAWGWIADRRIVVCGDFMIWGFPNAGNPQKVQRYAGEWAETLRSIIGKAPEYLIPAHGIPIRGEEAIARVLDDTAAALESLESGTLAMMNDGATLDQIIHGVRPPADLTDRPYLEPFYDDPEFVVHNIWRLYGGWWDGNPARLRPPPDAELAAELVTAMGGVAGVAERARTLLAGGAERLAASLAELCWKAAPDDPDAAAVRRDVFGALARSDRSLMVRGIFGAAAREAERSMGSRT